MSRNDRGGDDSAGNTDVDWSGFEPEAYFQHYYGEPHGDDDEVVRRASAFLIEAQPLGRPLDMVDVGTGPNLFPLLSALPRVGRLTVWEYAASNVAWLEREVFGGDELRPQWRHFWEVVRSSCGGHPLPEDPLERLRQTATIERGSIYDLPAARWDAATMFFCAESITSKRSEFDLACRRFAGCVRPGGSLAAAFLVGSSTYDVADRAFPVVDISEADIAEVFGAIARDVTTSCIGITDREVRSGYAGMVFLTARAP